MIKKCEGKKTNFDYLTEDELIEMYHIYYKDMSVNNVMKCLFDKNNINT